MPVSCENCPLRNCEAFVPMTDAEVAFMRQFKSGELRVDAGSTILMEGSNSPQLFTVLSGMGTRYKTLEDGNRQVINFLFPGDFIGMQAGIMGEMKHSIDASTPMVLCVFNRSDLWSMFKSHPDRAFDLTWIAAVEEHFLGETIATLGQRDAMEKIAWALLRMFNRLRMVGLEKAGAVPFPFRQRDLADALGLSLVHTNKTLSALRLRGLAIWSDGHLTIPDRGALAALSNASPEPLEKRPLM
ncbi:Crp/Fnr family transcriptional regulator [Pseudorhodobacter sp.]|uniref:Crp/Fnr family transcriptional regulator n=1 Tax=Pseudorhodobacter sp. TaxID=1934400 RepID=UPI002AFEE374|nr:Crp/Fnr family transcriptional regulator [Pseudorhodobacter sp.]